MNIKVKDWKEYVIENNVDSMEKLEGELAEKWLDDDGNLILMEDGEDYRKQFWGYYQNVFDDKVLNDDEENVFLICIREWNYYYDPISKKLISRNYASNISGGEEKNLIDIIPDCESFGYAEDEIIEKLRNWLKGEE